VPVDVIGEDGDVEVARILSQWAENERSPSGGGEPRAPSPFRGGGRRPGIGPTRPASSDPAAAQRIVDIGPLCLGALGDLSR